MKELLLENMNWYDIMELDMNYYNEYVIKYCSDDRVIAREYELV